MPLICLIYLANVILPFFSQKRLILEPLVFTGVISLLCISCHPPNVSFCRTPIQLITLRLIVKLIVQQFYPAGNYMFNLNNRNFRTRCEICLKLTIKTLEQRQSGVLIVSCEHISHLVLVFLLSTLSRRMPAVQVIPSDNLYLSIHQHMLPIYRILL